MGAGEGRRRPASPALSTNQSWQRAISEVPDALEASPGATANRPWRKDNGSTGRSAGGGYASFRLKLSFWTDIYVYASNTTRRGEIGRIWSEHRRHPCSDRTRT